MNEKVKQVFQIIGGAFRDESVCYLKVSGILMAIGMAIGAIFGFGSNEEPEKEEE
jgi:hypothetical protein